MTDSDIISCESLHNNRMWETNIPDKRNSWMQKKFTRVFGIMEQIIRPQLHKGSLRYKNKQLNLETSILYPQEIFT